MTRSKLTPRQKAFIDNTLLIHSYRTAYIAVYKPSGSRRAAMTSASHIYNKPVVQAYMDELRAIESKRSIDKAEAEHQAFRAKLGISR